MTEVFVCKTAYRRGIASRAISTSKKNCGKTGFGNYEPCGFVTSSFDDALRHVDMNVSCWVESHEGGDENKPVLREMHGSDVGGVYVQDYRKGSL